MTTEARELRCQSCAGLERRIATLEDEQAVARAETVRAILLICEREARIWHSKGSVRSAAKIRELMSMIALSVGVDGAHIAAEVKKLPSESRSKYALKRALKFIDDLSDDIPGARRHATRIRAALAEAPHHPCQSTSRAGWSVIAYVTEEVGRQGHDVGVLDGIERVGWMLQAWCEAIDFAARDIPPSLELARLLGRGVERIKNSGGWRQCGVRVGPRVCPDWQRVPELLEILFSNAAAFSPIEFYKEFELIHPFVDGNGRTGKILLNWMNGTLLAPIFPPADLFGYPIRNP